MTRPTAARPTAPDETAPHRIACPAELTASSEQTEPAAAQTDAPKVLSPHEMPPRELTASSEPTTVPPSARSDWYTDTLRAIVRRALDSDKPDIKGALAALQLLAETEDATAKQAESDVASILRDARRRVIDGKQS